MNSGADGRRNTGLPLKIREALVRESAPVRPVLPAPFRAALVVAIACAAGLAYLTIEGLRADSERMVSLPVWGPAVMRVLAATWLLVLAFRNAVPGTRSPRTARWIAVIGAPALLVALAEYLARAGGSPGPPHGTILAGMLGCYPKEIAVAVPTALGLAWLLSRSYPLHPVFVSVCGTLGVGLLADAALHLTCAATNVTHTLVVHGGAVATLAALGAAIGYLGGRRS